MIKIEDVLQAETTNLILIQQTIADEIIRRAIDNNVTENNLFSYLCR